MVISDLCILKPEAETNELMVVSLHPGVTKDQVIEATGWDIRFADALATTDLPTQNEIDVLRELKRVTEAAHSQSENAQ